MEGKYVGEIIIVDVPEPEPESVTEGPDHSDAMLGFVLMYALLLAGFVGGFLIGWCMR